MWRQTTRCARSLADPNARGVKVGIVARSSTPAELAKIARAEFEMWSRVLKDAGIKPE